MPRHNRPKSRHRHSHGYVREQAQRKRALRIQKIADHRQWGSLVPVEKRHRDHRRSMANREQIAQGLEQIGVCLPADDPHYFYRYSDLAVPANCWDLLPEEARRFSDQGRYLGALRKGMSRAMMGTYCRGCDACRPYSDPSFGWREREAASWASEVHQALEDWEEERELQGRRVSANRSRIGKLWC